jgi:hypothetical protein
MDLPIAPDPTPISAPSQLYKFDEQWNALEITGSCDTTWASDRTERRSMGGIVMMLAGAAVYYRTRLQPTIAQSSTEAELTNMADAGKAALYLTAFKGSIFEGDMPPKEMTPFSCAVNGAIARLEAASF